MKITEVSASYGRKKSDGDYGSRDVFFSITAELGPEEEVKKAQQELFDMCHEMVAEQFSQGEEVAGTSKPFTLPKGFKSDKQEVFMRGLNEVTGAIETPSTLDATYGNGSEKEYRK